MVDEVAGILVELGEKLPLLEEVTNPALQARHWVEVFEALGVLEEFCPVELERRAAAAAAAAEGKASDYDGLVRTPPHTRAVSFLSVHMSRRSLRVWFSIHTFVSFS